MKIGIFTDSYKPLINGVVTSICTLEEELRNNGHEVYIITTGSKEQINSDNNIIYIKSNLVPFKSFEGFRYKLFVKKHLKEIEKLNLDIVHVHTELSIGRLARHVIKKLNIPSVYTYHTMYEDYAHHIPFFGKGILKPSVILFFRWYTNKYVTIADRVIIPSNKVKDTLKRYNVEHKTTVIPTGLDLNKFNESNYRKTDIDNLKSKLNITSEKVFLFVGRIAQEKSIDVLINSFSNLKDLNFKFIIVGDGPSMNLINSQINDLKLNDKIITTGFVNWEDIGLYYQISDVFLNASLTETQGLTFIEALSSSVPVIAKYDDNLKEIITDNENGMFYYDDFELPIKIKELITNESLYNKLKTNSRQSVFKYDKEHFGLHMLEIYEELLNVN